MNKYFETRIYSLKLLGIIVASLLTIALLSLLSPLQANVANADQNSQDQDQDQEYGNSATFDFNYDNTNFTNQPFIAIWHRSTSEHAKPGLAAYKLTLELNNGISDSAEPLSAIWLSLDTLPLDAAEINLIYRTSSHTEALDLQELFGRNGLLPLSDDKTATLEMLIPESYGTPATLKGNVFTSVQGSSQPIFMTSHTSEDSTTVSSCPAHIIKHLHSARIYLGGNCIGNFTLSGYFYYQDVDLQKITQRYFSEHALQIASNGLSYFEVIETDQLLLNINEKLVLRPTALAPISGSELKLLGHDATFRLQTAKNGDFIKTSNSKLAGKLVWSNIDNQVSGFLLPKRSVSDTFEYWYLGINAEIKGQGISDDLFAFQDIQEQLAASSGDLNLIVAHAATGLFSPPTGYEVYFLYDSSLTAPDLTWNLQTSHSSGITNIPTLTGLGDSHGVTSDGRVGHLRVYNKLQPGLYTVIARLRYSSSVSRTQTWTFSVGVNQPLGFLTVTNSAGVKRLGQSSFAQTAAMVLKNRSFGINLYLLGGLFSSSLGQYQNYRLDLYKITQNSSNEITDSQTVTTPAALQRPSLAENGRYYNIFQAYADLSSGSYLLRYYVSFTNGQEYSHVLLFTVSAASIGTTTTSFRALSDEEILAAQSANFISANPSSSSSSSSSGGGGGGGGGCSLAHKATPPIDSLIFLIYILVAFYIFTVRKF